MIKPEIPEFEFEDHHIGKSGANAVEAEILYRAGFLSFDPMAKSEFPLADIQELAFLKKIYFESGMDSRMVRVMLNKLERPYRYSLDNIYWDLSRREWKEIKLV